MNHIVIPGCTRINWKSWKMFVHWHLGGAHAKAQDITLWMLMHVIKVASCTEFWHFHWTIRWSRLWANLFTHTCAQIQCEKIIFQSAPYIMCLTQAQKNERASIVLEMDSYHILHEMILRSIRWHQRFIHFINFLLKCIHANCYWPGSD